MAIISFEDHRRIERVIRGCICNRFLRSQGNDSVESVPPVYVAWRAGTTNRVVVAARQAGNRFLYSLKGLKYGLSLLKLS